MKLHAEFAGEERHPALHLLLSPRERQASEGLGGAGRG